MSDKLSLEEKMNEANTVIVQAQKRFGRIDYEACNAAAAKFLDGFKQQSFSEADLKFIKSLGYTVILQGTETKEL